MTQQGIEKVLSRLVDKYVPVCVCDGKGLEGLIVFFLAVTNPPLSFWTTHVA